MAFHPLAHLHQLYDGYKQVFRVAGYELLLIQNEGKTFLIENRCPHMDARLDTGDIAAEQTLRCRVHGIAFDLYSGKAQGPLGDSIDCLRRFTLVYQGNQLGVDL